MLEQKGFLVCDLATCKILQIDSGVIKMWPVRRSVSFYLDHPVGVTVSVSPHYSVDELTGGSSLCVSQAKGWSPSAGGGVLGEATSFLPTNWEPEERFKLPLYGIRDGAAKELVMHLGLQISQILTASFNSACVLDMTVLAQITAGGPKPQHGGEPSPAIPH